MAYCPNCAAELAAEATRCPNCDATFGKGADWAPLAQPPDLEAPSTTTRVVSIVLKVVLVLVSIAALGLGGTVAYSERNPGAGHLMVLAAIVVVVVAITTRLRWSFLAVCIAVPVGLATCASNFKWHGG